jgi:uncharacterized protein (TIGR02217 family)
MAEYPTTPKPQNPVNITARFNNIISTADSGREQRRRKSVQNLYDVKLTYSALSLANLNTLWAFYQARRGTFESFYFYDLTESRTTHYTQYVGVGDASTTIFDIPGKNTSGQTIYVNGVAKTVTTDYTILTGGGTESADRISFVVAPAAGYIITVTFTGDLRIKCRFKEDKLTREGLLYCAYRTGIELYGLPA